MSNAGTPQIKYYVVSGEGENGTRELYTGKLTVRAIKARLKKEECGGDRWARIETEDGERIDDVDAWF